MIGVVELRPNDILVIKVPIGNMPPARAKEYLEQIKVMVSESIEHEKILLFPVRASELEMCIIKRS